MDRRDNGLLSWFLAAFRQEDGQWDWQGLGFLLVFLVLGSVLMWFIARLFMR